MNLPNMRDICSRVYIISSRVFYQNVSSRRLFTPLERRSELHHECSSHQKNVVLQQFSDCCCWHISAALCVWDSCKLLCTVSGYILVWTLTDMVRLLRQSVWAFFYSVNNSPSFLFIFLLPEPGVSSAKTGCVRVLQFQILMWCNLT